MPQVGREILHPSAGQWGWFQMCQRSEHGVAKTISAVGQASSGGGRGGEGGGGEGGGQVFATKSIAQIGECELESTPPLSVPISAALRAVFHSPNHSYVPCHAPTPPAPPVCTHGLLPMSSVLRAAAGMPPPPCAVLAF